MIYIKDDLTCLETIGECPEDFEYIATIDDDTFDQYGGQAGAGTHWEIIDGEFVGLEPICEKRICRLRNTYFEINF